MLEKIPDTDPTAIDRTRQLLLQQRTPHGHWEGELSMSALSTATAISALTFFLQKKLDCPQKAVIESQIETGLCWLVELQNKDGGWGDTPSNYSNISTSMLVIAAFHSCNRTEQFSELIDSANDYVQSQGGVEGIRSRYGKDKTFAVPILANAAMAGLVPWSEVAALPFEAACVPQRFYNLLNLPVVSYAIPALVAIGQAKFHFDPPWNPFMRWIRKRCIDRSLAVLEKTQPESGGYLEAVPLTSFVSMALIQCGRADHPVVKNGIRFLIDSFRTTKIGSGAWPIDTNLATWVTTLSVNALATDPAFKFRPDENWQRCLDWILGCQYKTVHPFTGAAPGGWGWSDLSGAVPDADDTPGALLAIANLRDRCELTESSKRQIETAAVAGVEWLLRLQNRDGGWPTFCRGWGRLPFDRSGSDITAHAIRALHVWRESFSGQRSNTSPTRERVSPLHSEKHTRSFMVRYVVSVLTRFVSMLRHRTSRGATACDSIGLQSDGNRQSRFRVAERRHVEGERTAEPPDNSSSHRRLVVNRGRIDRAIERAIERGFRFLEQKQEKNGSWLPLWFGNQDQSDEINPFYGTAKVLHAYYEANRFHTHAAQNGLQWIRRNQNDDGGWGGGPRSEPDAPESGQSSVEETALCTEALLLDENKESQTIAACGIEWLKLVVENDEVGRCSAIGFYFAKLWYFEKLYPLIFATSALGSVNASGR